MPMKLVKVYLEPGQKPPKGVKVEKGPKGGQYFMGTPSQKKAHEKPGAAPEKKPNVNIFNEPKTIKRGQNEPHPHDVQDREFQDMIKSNAPKNIKGLHAGHLIKVDQVPGAEYRVMGSIKKKGNKTYLPVKVVKHKDQNRIGQLYDAPVNPKLKFQVIGLDITPSEKQKVERQKLIKQLNATQDALDKYEMSRKDSASQWNPGGKSYADPKVIKKYNDKIKNIMDKINNLRKENIMKNKNILIRDLVREEIKKILKESIISQKDLIKAFKKKSKNQVMMIYLKNNKEVAIDDLNQLTQDKKYGYGTDKNGNEIEYMFSEIKNYIVK